MLPHIRLIGDIHNHMSEYFALIRGIPYTVQLGDLSFNYSPIATLDPKRHRVVLGNHDNYDNPPVHSLGDSGISSFPLKNGEFKFFFVRGGFSIDSWRRIEGRNWWEHKEQLNWQQSNSCVEAWAATKPEIVLSHDCPAFLVPQVVTNEGKLDSSHTGRLLEKLWSIHQPKLWVFGHHHQNKVINVGDTKFMALSGTSHWGRKAGYVDIDENGNVGEPQL